MTLGALLVRFLVGAVIVIAAGTVRARAGDLVALPYWHSAAM